MKKSFLLLITLFTAAFSAMALTDGQTYPEVDKQRNIFKKVADADGCDKYCQR